MDINNRIRIFLKHKKITVQNFESSIGKTNGYLAHTKSPTAGVISEIMSIYPDMNIEWLLTGKGEMLKNNSMVAAEPYITYGKFNDGDEIKRLRDELKEAYIEIGRLQGENRLLREQVGLGERKVNGKSA